jgi:hypothetical protein
MTGGANRARGSAVGEVMVHRFADDLEVALDRVD